MLLAVVLSNGCSRCAELMMRPEISKPPDADATRNGLDGTLPVALAMQWEAAAPGKLSRCITLGALLGDSDCIPRPHCA